MNDELKNKAAKVKVSGGVRSDDDLINAPITRVPGKEAAQQSLALTVDARPARDERNNQSRDRKHEPSPWRTVFRAPCDETPEKSRSCRY